MMHSWERDLKKDKCTLMVWIQFLVNNVNKIYSNSRYWDTSFLCRIIIFRVAISKHWDVAWIGQYFVSKFWGTLKITFKFLQYQNTKGYTKKMLKIVKRYVTHFNTFFILDIQKFLCICTYNCAHMRSNI